MSDDMKSIIERIKKLNAKAESCKSIGSLAEAEAFAEAVEKMLLKYKLDESVLTQSEQDAVNPMDMTYINWADTPIGAKSRRIAWTERLTRHVARAHFCEDMVVPGSNANIIVGRLTDRTAAAFVLTVLAVTAKLEADKAYRKERYAKWKVDAMSDAHGFREAFIFGFVKRIGERYDAMKAAAQKDPVTGGTMQMIFIKSTTEVKKFIDDLGGKKAPGTKMSANHTAGYNAGRAAADKANLKGTGVGAASTSSAVGAGMKQLGAGR